MIPNEQERRSQRRTELVRPCRLFDPRTGKYLHGTTCDLTVEGVLIRITRPCHLNPGDTFMIGIAMNEKTGLLRAKDMFEATVVRALGTPSNHTLVAFRCAKSSIPIQSGLSEAA